ncbi:GFA family protein [Sphingomonas sp.]|uniref:GFA family protein n=1 Tax=Sphingomonas sp. TaxID=28214 RepID=UPI001D46E824|nr:GFA family protein [Sphingomonas sp.]MBX9796568.1 GFA family protein [Sphingomonas sp.]
MKGDLTGGCICGAVRYTLHDGFRFRPYACHCTECQPRTGSAFSEHMLFARQDLTIEGALDAGAYTQPSGAGSTIWGCATCKTRIFAENDTRPGFASLRCGTLDRSAEIVPAAHLWVGSKQAWVMLPEGVPALAEQPRSPAEWMALVGPQKG